MWSKPDYKEPNFETKSFVEMTEENASEITGGMPNIGTCYVAGYTCWSAGGFKIGTCYVVGIACNFSKGGV